MGVECPLRGFLPFRVPWAVHQYTGTPADFREEPCRVVPLAGRGPVEDALGGTSGVIIWSYFEKLV